MINFNTAGRIVTGYTQRASSTETKQTSSFADSLAAAQTQAIEAKQGFTITLPAVTIGANGSYPTQEQLDYLTEKYGDMDFSAYRSYDNVKQYADGSWGCSIGTGYSDAYSEFMNDLYDMGILTNQEKSLLELDLVRVGSINELGGFDFDSNIRQLWHQNDFGLSMETALSGRGSSIDLIDYLRERAEVDRQSAAYAGNTSEVIYQAGDNTATSEIFSAAAEVRGRVANILDVIVNGNSLTM